MEKNTRTIIVGGGLAGLVLADRLQNSGEDFLLLEARERLGGRIKTHLSKNGAFDLGATWFWPNQRHMSELVKQFSLTFFEQHTAGKICIEDKNGIVEKINITNPMQGSYRLEGGIQKLIDALAATIAPDKFHLKTKVTSIEIADALTVKLEDGTTLKSERIVLCLPPRIAAKINFEPKLERNILKSMDAIPTWMAGQAKFVAIYKTAFWRDHNLSGTAFSSCGPLTEIHDASEFDGNAALFGFVGIPAALRKGAHSSIKRAALEQLIRVYGSDSASPLEVILQDWNNEPETTTLTDQEGSNATPHFTQQIGALLPHLADGRIILGAAEMSSDASGLLEGAIDRAKIIADYLLCSL